MKPGPTTYSVKRAPKASGNPGPAGWVVHIDGAERNPTSGTSFNTSIEAEFEANRLNLQSAREFKTLSGTLPSSWDISHAADFSSVGTTFNVPGEGGR